MTETKDSIARPKSSAKWKRFPTFCPGKQREREAFYTAQVSTPPLLAIWETAPHFLVRTTEAASRVCTTGLDFPGLQEEAKPC